MDNGGWSTSIEWYGDDNGCTSSTIDENKYSLLNLINDGWEWCMNDKSN
jgi:hypothetical protein